MRQTPEISIIVPIYNVERFLHESLDSIEAQTFRDWECILVDDGSPDNSGAICDEYVARDKRFRVLHLENGGVSAARNAGVAAARGKYIGFVDPDDHAFPDLFLRLHELITTYDADMAQVSYEDVYTTFSRPRHLVKEKKVMERKEVLRELFYDREIPNYLWNKLLRREVITGPFKVGKCFEDISAFTAWAVNIKRAVLVPEILYHYRRRKGSIVHANFSRHMLDYVDALLERGKRFREIEPGALSDEEVCRFQWQTVLTAGKTVARLEKDFKVRDAVVRQISEISKGLPLPRVKCLGLKKWWRSRLLLDDPRRFIRMMRLVYKTDFHAHYCFRNLFD